MLIEKAADMIADGDVHGGMAARRAAGPEQRRPVAGLGWSPREMAFLVHLIKVGGFTFVLLARLRADPGLGRSRDAGGARRSIPRSRASRRWQHRSAPASRCRSCRRCASATASPRPPWTRPSRRACRGPTARATPGRSSACCSLIFFTSALATTMADARRARPRRAACWARARSAAVITWTAAILVSYGGTAAAATGTGPHLPQPWATARCARSGDLAGSNIRISTRARGQAQPCNLPPTASSVRRGEEHEIRANRAAGRPAADRRAASGICESSIGATHFRVRPLARLRRAVPLAAGEDRHQQMELLVAVAGEGDRG